MAVSKANPFIKALKKQFSYIVSQPYDQIKSELSKKDIDTDTYL